MLDVIFANIHTAVYVCSYPLSPSVQRSIDVNSTISRSQWTKIVFAYALQCVNSGPIELRRKLFHKEQDIPLESTANELPLREIALFIENTCKRYFKRLQKF